MIQCKENEEIEQETEEEYDYMNEEPLEEAQSTNEDEEPDYCD